MRHQPTDEQENRVNAALRAFDALDLSNLELKLANRDLGKKLSADEIHQCRREYRAFIALSVAYTGEILVPSQRADEFWHAHILDTRAYQRDSESLFGFFFHHFPYLGMRGPDDENLLHQQHSRTAHLVRTHFPHLYWTSSYCGGGGGGGGCGGGGGGDMLPLGAEVPTAR